MKTLLFAAGVALIATAACAADGPGVYTSAATLNGTLAKATDDPAVFNVPTGPHGPVVVAARRGKTGDVEVHDAMNDVFVVREGTATVLVGGKVEGNKQTAPGEWRGGKITGATSYAVGPGDLLFIPAGQPHLVEPKSKSFTYLAFKSAK
jgi:mannose-6-phosphate isomerase-like protein (cupin superfamily)